MKYIGSGISREVFLIGRYAVKLPKVRYGWSKFLEGLLANMQEAVWGRSGYPEICPVVFSVPGGWCVVQRRADPLPEDQWRDFSCVFSADEAGGGSIRPWITRSADYFIPTECKRDSFGVLDGRIVAVDYG